MKIFPFSIASRGSFKRQIILTFVVGFFLLIAAFAAYMVQTESDYLYRNSNNETTSLAQSLAVSSVSWVLANDLEGLQEVVHSFQSHPGLRYAMVISPSGRVLAHSDATKVGQFVSDERSLTLIKAPPEKRVLTDDKSMIDIAVPIMVDHRHVAWARIALGREGIAANLRKMIMRSVLFVLLSMVLSLLAALLIANRLGHRIGSLVQVAKEVQAGNFDTRAKISGVDEVSILGNSLNQMLDALAQDEEQLRSASLYTRSLIEASLDPLVTISREGKITDVNKATEDVTGRSRSELIGTDFSDYFTEPDKARESYRQAFQEGPVTDYPLAIRHKDGYFTEVLYNASVYRNEAGEVLGVFAAARDVTERKMAEQEVVKLSLQNRLILDSAGEGIYGLGIDGRCTFVNPAASQLLGFMVEELIGQHIHSMFHHTKPDGRPYPEEECPVHEAYKQGVVHRGVDLYWRKDGSSFQVEFVSTPILEAGKTTGAVLMFRDITERKLAEEQIRRSEQGLAEAQRIAHLGNWDLDLVHNVLTWSDEIYRIFEIDPEKFGASYDAFLDAIHPDDRELVNRAYTESVKNRVPYDIAHRLLMKDGRVKYVNEKCETHYSEDGKPLRSVGTVHDITEIKKAEDKVKELNRDLERRVAGRTSQLEAANKELEAFSYSVSHDLRTPLRAIDGFSRILLDDYADRLDDEGKRLLNVVRDNTRRMGQLIDDILKFSRAGRAEITFSEIDMEKLARKVFEDIQPSVDASKLQLEIEHLPPARGDPAMLRQVFVNLLSNAIKFSRTREVARIKVGGSIEGAEAVYFVKDNGVGFDMQYVDKLFGVFQRLHAVTEFEGTGIGLAIVKRIITRHGGRVRAEGKTGKGAAIYFALPTKEKEHG
ncbi:MAG TPA: PAS domain S-box protein [Sulfuricella sp.]|nr:PAS domain S-box protein [Sulfuricella sp.]